MRVLLIEDDSATAQGINLPDMPGFDVLKTLRMAKINTPIFILSGTNDIDSKVRGLGTGADDYMTKPFHKDELIARIHAVVRRSKGHSQSIITTGDIKVSLKLLTCLSVSCARKLPRQQRASIISKQFGDAAMCFVIQPKIR